MRAEVSPKQSCALIHKVAHNTALFFESTVGMDGFFKRLLSAGTGVVELPAVVLAAEAVLFHYAVGQVDPPVGAPAVDEAKPAGAVAVEHQVFTQQPHLFRAEGAGLQLCGARDGVPVVAHERAHGRAGADACEQFVVFDGKHRACNLRTMNINGFV